MAYKRVITIFARCPEHPKFRPGGEHGPKGCQRCEYMADMHQYIREVDEQLQYYKEQIEGTREGPEDDPEEPEESDIPRYGHYASQTSTYAPVPPPPSVMAPEGQAGAGLGELPQMRGASQGEAIRGTNEPYSGLLRRYREIIEESRIGRTSR